MTVFDQKTETGLWDLHRISRNAHAFYCKREAYHIVIECPSPHQTPCGRFADVCRMRAKMYRSQNIFFISLLSLAFIPFGLSALWQTFTRRCRLGVKEIALFRSFLTIMVQLYNTEYKRDKVFKSEMKALAKTLYSPSTKGLLILGARELKQRMSVPAHKPFPPK